HTRARGWQPHVGGPVSNEIIELERTLVALGDAYVSIARRMDGSDQRPHRPTGIFGRLHALVDSVARFPLTLYLLMILLLQGVDEIHIPGALQNLGRAQDWTVARLFVLAVSAYRRARSLAIARGADDSADEVAERLAGLYTQMGAYDAAASAYETLLARPTTITRAWRQAVWRLELGEVLVLQGRHEQAAEVLTSARPIFESQQAPIQKARTLSALGAAHHLRANAAEARGDSRTAATLDDLTIDSCRAALVAWADVTTLQGDESASVDPALAISNVGHQLWLAARSPRMGDEQQHNARVLLETIEQRHFPQRFEHPVLRLFRVLAAVLLPAYLLAGLLMAVQLPNSVQIRTQTALAFAPPLLDLTRFPNDLIAGKTTSLTAAEASAFSVVNLTKLANRSVRLEPSPPQLDPLGTTRVVLIIMLVYLLSYTAFGLAVITFSSPAQFQSRRPGRLILHKDQLSWRGPAGQGSLMDALRWIKEDARYVRARLWRRLIGLFGGSAAHDAKTKPVDATIALADIASATAVDRRAFGYLLSDFSFTVLEPKDPKRRSVLIPGSIVRYPELCDELERRMHHPRIPFGVDFIRSGWGICFVLTLLYTLVLTALLPLTPARLNRPLVLDYSLLNLYVLATPGLLLPLLWWFIAQPLGASSNSSWAALPLAATALVGAALTAGVLSDSINLATFGLRPDLATPVLAAGFLAALVFYAPRRPFRRTFAPRLGSLARVLLAIGALVGVTVLAWHIATTLRWYNALVHGNRLIEQALAPDGCASRADGCSLIDQAIESYDEVTCLRPSDSDGFAFRGFAYLVKHDYQSARTDFERALGQRPPDPGCLPGAAPSPTEAQRVSLYTNLGAVDTLLAREPPLSNSEIHYQSALRSYGQALLPSDPDPDPSCASLALNLLQPAGSVDAVLGLDLLGPSAGAIKAEQAPLVLQLADVCYSRGSARAELLTTNLRQGRGMNRDTARLSAWRDLAAAAAEYRAVVAASAEPKDQELGRRGLAATWLALSQLDPPPIGAPDRHTALLQALAVYQDLERSGQRDPSVYIGQAWSSIQMGAWDSAKVPLAAASALAPNDPTYPALQGLVAWLDSTQYDVPKKGLPSPGYTAAISNALGLYSRVIDLGQVELPRAYTTRSLLYFSMRNSPRGETYADDDYESWMRLAIADADQALLAAARDGLPPERQVGYRYWRGRLSFTLALTWQEKSRGLHDWADLVPLYSSAYADFTTAAAVDLNPERRKIFRDMWIPWSGVLHANATHMQFAQEAARKGDFARARGELALVDPLSAVIKKWDSRAAPLPDYHFLHGLVSLGLGMPVDFPNPVLKANAGARSQSDAEADYAAAIAV
ncbi:MAG TPA: tetratricopeptide repeat protein, partial [Roseiflexaceae bacterium]|nr:tetratricopeptide repeat protein [Roseiflexaceae bacterium]